MKKSKAVPAVDRLEGKYFVSLTPNEHTGTPCHLWTAALTSGKRYPTMSHPERGMVYAYRVAYEAAYGPIPAGPCDDGSLRTEAHHLCLDKRCIRPDHISIVSSKEHRALHAQLRREEKARKAAQLRKIGETHRAEMDRFFSKFGIPPLNCYHEIVEHDE